MPTNKNDTISKGIAFIADTNVFVHDPDSIDTLRENGNTLVIPFIVILELDRLKEKPDIGLDAREAINRIEEIRKNRDNSLIVFRNPSFKNLGELNRNVPDHQVIATAKTLQRKEGMKFEDIRLISRDRTVRILARELGLRADDYFRNQITTPKYCLKELNVRSECITSRDSLIFPCSPYVTEDIKENEGVVCYSDFNFNSSFQGQWRKSFAAIRKGENFKIIDSNIGASGIKPYSLNGNGENWCQHIALSQLLDPAIELVFLQGGAGSGKTLLALASAIQQRHLYRQIIIARPMIHLEDEDRMGFLPGDEHEKMSPWLHPIKQALNFLKEIKGSDNKALITSLLDNKKIDFVSLDYIRGMTFFKTFLILDDGQNLTPHQAKTIITRAGMHTKLVFTGDLGQIDRRRRLDEKSSGLAYAMATMGNLPSVGVTIFKETVRSSLASLAEERM